MISSQDIDSLFGRRRGSVVEIGAMVFVIWDKLTFSPHLPFSYGTLHRRPLDFSVHIAPAQSAAHTEFVVIEDVFAGLAKCRDAVDLVQRLGFEAGGGMFGGLDGQRLGHGRQGRRLHYTCFHSDGVPPSSQPQARYCTRHL